jgi:hypothetical protein
MNGRQIFTLDDLKNAVNAKQSIVVPNTRSFQGPIPAAFAINMSGTILLRLFGDGMFIYEKPKKGSKNHDRAHTNPEKRVRPIGRDERLSGRRVHQEAI